MPPLRFRTQDEEVLITQLFGRAHQCIPDGVLYNTLHTSLGPTESQIRQFSLLSNPTAKTTSIRNNDVLEEFRIISNFTPALVYKIDSTTFGFLIQCNSHL